jgi:hypothetical protein
MGLVANNSEISDPTEIVWHTFGCLHDAFTAPTEFPSPERVEISSRFGDNWERISDLSSGVSHAIARRIIEGELEPARG